MPEPQLHGRHTHILLGCPSREGRPEFVQEPALALLVLLTRVAVLAVQSRALRHVFSIPEELTRPVRRVFEQLGH